MAVEQSQQADILAIGSCVLDISCTLKPPPNATASSEPIIGSSNAARITQCVGGVAHNMALAAHYAGASVQLTTVIADDDIGDLLLRKIQDEGLSVEGIIKLPSSGTLQTGTYVGNYDTSKRLLFGMADVSLMKDISLENRGLWMSLISKAAPKWILLDTCFSSEVSSIILDCARSVRARVLVDLVSVPLARTLFSWFTRSLPLYPHSLLDVLSLNALELDAVHDAALSEHLYDRSDSRRLYQQLNCSPAETLSSKLSSSNLTNEVVCKAVSLLPFFPTILLTLGEEGCVVAILIPRNDDRLSRKGYTPHIIPAEDSAPAAIFLKHYPSKNVVSDHEIVSINGAGDSFKGALFAKIVSNSKLGRPGVPFEDETNIDFAHKAAACSVRDERAVSSDIRSLLA